MSTLSRTDRAALLGSISGAAAVEAINVLHEYAPSSRQLCETSAGISANCQAVTGG